jgi:hypothetical protein
VDENGLSDHSTERQKKEVDRFGKKELSTRRFIEEYPPKENHRRASSHGDKFISKLRPPSKQKNKSFFDNINDEKKGIKFESTLSNKVSKYKFVT